MRARITQSLWIACFLLGSWPTQVSAYGYESPVSDGCHEAITTEALRRVREDLAEARPLSNTKRDEVLLDELPFTVASDLESIDAVSLLLGVRDNDLKGRDAIDSTALAKIHGDADGQREHCLRRPEHDEPATDDPDRDELPSGSEQAIVECRGFIRDKVARALTEGLDDAGLPDADRRTPLSVHLEFSGRESVELPIFYLYLGQALHTLQDSFTHTFRTDDLRRVKVVLNWVDFAEGNHRERRDGPAHGVALDQCRNQDERLKERLDDLKNAAVRASEDMLHAALTGPVEDRMEAVDAVLDAWLQMEPGCTIDNGWCEAPEIRLVDSGPVCSCAVGPGARRSSTRSSILLVVASVFLLGLRRARRRRRRGSAAVVAAALLLLGDSAHPVQAQEHPAAETPAPAPTTDSTNALAAPAPEPTPALACVPGRQIACACASGGAGAQRCLPDGSGYDACAGCTARTKKAEEANEAEEPVAEDAFSEAISRLAAYVATGASIDNAALAFSGAVRYQLHEDWLIGADGEFNPWFSVNTGRFELGTANFYGTLIRRYVISDKVALRTTAHFGTSILLVDLIGAPSGSTGFYVGGNLLGLELQLVPSLYLIIDPADVSMPIPHLTGAPLSYRQYRFTVGLQLGP